MSTTLGCTKQVTECKEESRNRSEKKEGVMQEKMVKRCFIFIAAPKRLRIIYNYHL